MTIAERVEARIKRSRRDVFVRDDFSDIAGYDQIGRALRELCKKELLMKIGYGIYTKARKNRINNRLMPAASGGPDSILLETLQRLNVPYELSGLTAAYAAGKTTQIPASMEVRVKKRFSRKLVIGSTKLNAT